MRIVHPSGPTDARIMLVGEAPGETEERQGIPFCGESGRELDRMLQEARIARSECFATNVVRARPPGNDISQWIMPLRKQPKKPYPADFIEYRGRMVAPFVPEHVELLKQEIAKVRPHIVVALGNTPMWILLGHEGVASWRGSVTWSHEFSVKVMPALHPAYILRSWQERFLCVNDFKRLRDASESAELDEPRWDFTVAPSFNVVIDRLRELTERSRAFGLPLAVDIETSRGDVTCIGLGWNELEAMCIPIVRGSGTEYYWPVEQELIIIDHLRALLTLDSTHVIGQNFLYDAQYFALHYGFVPNLVRDTEVTQHVLLPGTAKDLATLASLYCKEYCFWKHESKEAARDSDVHKAWRYNCTDCVRTYEIAVAQQPLVTPDIAPVWRFQQALFWPLLKMMLRGVRVDAARKDVVTRELDEAAQLRLQNMEYVLGHPFNPRSPKQMHALFYDDFNLPQQRKRKTHKVSLDDESLRKLAEIEPVVKPLIQMIQEYRSLSVFSSTFAKSAVDEDGRMRCMYNPARAETFRLTSSENAFGRGLNLQNIPAGSEQ